MSSVVSRCLGAGSISLLHSGTLPSQQRTATATVATQRPVTTGHPGPSLGRVQLTVAFQRLCTSAPAAPLLLSGLARGNSEKPALEAYLQDTKHGSVSPGPRPRAPPARPAQQQQRWSRYHRQSCCSTVLPGKGLWLHSSSLSWLQLKGTHLPSCRGEAGGMRGAQNGRVLWCVSDSCTTAPGVHEC